MTYIIWVKSIINPFLFLYSYIVYWYYIVYFVLIMFSHVAYWNVSVQGYRMMIAKNCIKLLMLLLMQAVRTWTILLFFQDVLYLSIMFLLLVFSFVFD